MLTTTKYFPVWSSEWPQEPGWYWFYGIRSEWADVADLFPVNVRRASRGCVYIASGAFLYAEEGVHGVFCPMVVPELPNPALTE